MTNRELKNKVSKGKTLGIISYLIIALCLTPLFSNRVNVDPISHIQNTVVRITCKVPETTFSFMGIPLVTTPAQTVTGSGVIINKEGLVVTNAHVMEGCAGGDITVDIKDSVTTGEWVAEDVDKDLALLQLSKGEYEFASFGMQPHVGDTVYAQGSPLGIRSMLTKGVIGSNVTNGKTKIFLSDVKILPGNSGGGLFNTFGNLVGINEAIIVSENGNISVTIQGEEVEEFINDYLKSVN